MFKKASVQSSLITVGGVIGAYAGSDLAALYVALVGPAILYTLHVIEVKLNRLLDERGITVWPNETD